MSSDVLLANAAKGANAEPFRYLAVERGNAETSLDPNANPLGSNAAGKGRAQADREEEAHQRGIAEGLAQGRTELEKNVAAVRAQLSDALREFALEREAYFERVEREVVQLSLAIARKILHRESQLDPLLLAGIVRVALEKINTQTELRLRANPADVGFWREYFGQAHGIERAPEIIGDPALAPGLCVLETQLGSTQIGLDTQLKEIEQGFLDLLAQRPRVR